MDSDNSRVFRIDRFTVPPTAELEFLRAVAETNSVFDDIEGCLQRHLLKQQKQSGDNVFVTIVEWASEAAIREARQAAAAKHREMKLNPKQMFDRLQIKAELGNFVPLSNAGD